MNNSTIGLVVVLLALIQIAIGLLQIKDFINGKGMKWNWLWERYILRKEGFTTKWEKFNLLTNGVLLFVSGIAELFIGIIIILKFRF